MSLWVRMDIACSYATTQINNLQHQINQDTRDQLQCQSGLDEATNGALYDLGHITVKTMML